MAHGVPTDEATVAEFRAKFLYSGNASKCGRDLNIPDRTARLIAERIEEEPGFAEERRKLRARALDRHVAMRLRVCETALERFEDEHGGIDVKRFGGEDAESVIITDKRHEYGKLVLEAEKNAANLARLDAEQNAGKFTGTPRLEIVLTDKDDEPGDDGPK